MERTLINMALGAVAVLTAIAVAKTWRNWKLAGLCVAALVVIAVLLAVLGRLAGLSREAICLANLKDLGHAMYMYAEDWSDRLPPPDKWNQAAGYSNKGFLICPSAPDQRAPSYAMNRDLGGMRLRQVSQADDVVMLFESVSGADLAGGHELLPQRPRHPRGNSVCFADGRTRSIGKAETRGLAWRLAPHR